MGNGATWTDEHVKYLERSWGRVAIKTIASRLNRTVRAVRCKAIRLNLGNYHDSNGNISLALLLSYLGVKRFNKSLVDRLIKDGLPIKKQRMVSRWFYMVDIDKFWKWADAHRNYFNYYKLEPLVLGREPAWVDEQRHIDYKCKRPARRWSHAEDSLLEYMVNKGATCKAISERLNRSERAVGTRCYLLGIAAPRRAAYIKWRPEEHDRLLELWSVHQPIKYIAEQMGRSECSIESQLRILLSKTDNGCLAAGG